ncbi:MAG: hypothetical protein K9M45_08015 [Kiritimatiellales bacterium]|nr:hypothetical protein [Kiritimatiellales bacterium]
MKRLFILLIGLGILPVCQADMASRFELCREMEGDFKAGQVGRLRVPGDVFDRCRAFPNDLRILDAAGKQWPFYLFIPKDNTVSKELVPEILNASFVEGKERYWQFDLRIPEVDGKVPVHNRLELISSGGDYVRRVEVFTAAAPRGHMASGYLIHFSRHRKASSRTIRYPVSDAARLHVRVYANAKDADEKFSVTGAKIYHRSVIEAEREMVVFTEAKLSGRDKDKNAQTLLLDTGFENRPVEFVTFDVENTTFARSVSIQGRNRGNEPWQWVGGGEIHRFKDEAETTVKFHAKTRYLKIDLFHYDDQPLTVHGVTLEAAPRHLVFEAAGAGPAALCFRAWDMKPPRYDLKGRLAQQAAATAPGFQTLETKPNQLVKTHPWRKYSKLLGALAVGGVSLLVIWIIVSMLKQQKLMGGKEE